MTSSDGRYPALSADPRVAIRRVIAAINTIQFQ